MFCLRLLNLLLQHPNRPSTNIFAILPDSLYHLTPKKPLDGSSPSKISPFWSRWWGPRLATWPSSMVMGATGLPVGWRDHCTGAFCGSIRSLAWDEPDVVGRMIENTINTIYSMSDIERGYLRLSTGICEARIMIVALDVCSIRCSLRMMLWFRWGWVESEERQCFRGNCLCGFWQGLAKNCCWSVLEWVWSQQRSLRRSTSKRNWFHVKQHSTGKILEGTTSLPECHWRQWYWQHRFGRWNLKFSLQTSGDHHDGL